MATQMNERSPVRMDGIMLRIAAVLFVLTVISVYLLAGVLARYVSDGRGSDDARVAKFGALTMTETGDFDGTGTKKGMIIPGVDLQKDVSVHFSESEVLTIVFVEVILSNDWERTDHTFSLGGNLSWAVTDDWSYLDADIYNSMDRYIFYQIVEPNHELTADIIAEDGRIVVGSDITEANIASFASGSISLRASAIQANGSDSVKDVWNVIAAK